ncbi:hypothetical protein HJC23_008720 [Cyclotella cryptica]|uniref:BTB domain-containing protein n=1 Tax=Cyclotella cryptica TaxID=29204 RepID=A0ABD3PD73_9STRA
MVLSGAITHVGTPPTEQVSEKHTVKFHDFESLTKTKGERVISPVFSCAGHKWILQLYPGGDVDSQDGMVAAYLQGKMSYNIAVALLELIFKDSNGCPFHKQTCCDFRLFSMESPSWGWKNFIKRDKILNSSDKVLPSGTLEIEVCIQLHTDYLCRSVEPQSTLAEDVMTILNDEGSADVAFQVMGKVIFAHKSILKARASDLAVMCDSWDKTNPVPIDDVEPEIFEIMLKDRYGEPVPAAVWKEKAEPILRAAKKYGFGNLKHVAEVWHVNNLKLTVDNVVDWILYADGNDLTLLKKASMEFIAASAVEVITSESWLRLQESPSLSREVILAIAKQLEQNSESKKRKRGE